MRRPLQVLIGALALPVLTAAPAYAVDNVICVNTAGACDQTVATVQLAISAAAGNGLPDTILVGPGTYTDGPYTLDGTGEAITLRGAGQASTFFTLPSDAAQQDYVSAQGALLEDFTVTMEPASSSGDHGLSVYGGATVEGVTVEGTGLSNATAAVALDAELSDVTLSLPGNNRGVYSTGGTTVRDGTLTADYGFVSSSDPSAPETLSRLTINASTGVSLDGGLIKIDSSVVRITSPTGGVGLLAANPNNGTTAKTINADHVTIVGGGPGSVGVAAIANAPGAKQTSLVTLDDSIVRGQNASLEVAASNDGSQGGNSDAKILTQYSSWDAEGQSIVNGLNGTTDIAVGAGVLDDPDPLFVDASGGDYRLRPTSPLIDVGDPVVGAPAKDRDRTTRVVDGDLDGTAVRDLGAYEFHDTTAPDTVLVSGPAGPTRDATPTFAFSSEPGATFQCRVDAAAYTPCTSPFTSGALGQGAHTFAVRATDTFGNADPTPATRSIRVDTVGPTTRFKKRPATEVTTARVTFRFKASERGATFACAVDGGKLRTCKPRTTFTVGLGKHQVKVRAIDALGNRGRTAKYSFTRIRP